MTQSCCHSQEYYCLLGALYTCYDPVMFAIAKNIIACWVLCILVMTQSCYHSQEYYCLLGTLYNNTIALSPGIPLMKLVKNKELPGRVYYTHDLGETSTSLLCPRLWHLPLHGRLYHAPLSPPVGKLRTWNIEQ